MFCLSRLLSHHAAATAAAHATTGTVSNLGFLGPPLVLAIFGARGAGPLAMAILAEVMVLLSVGEHQDCNRQITRKVVTLAPPPNRPV